MSVQQKQTDFLMNAIETRGEIEETAREYRFRLNSATTVVHHRIGFKDKFVVIPAGDEVVSFDPIKMRTGFDRAKLIEVEWNFKTVRMFLCDLMERGESIETAGR